MLEVLGMGEVGFSPGATAEPLVAAGNSQLVNSIESISLCNESEDIDCNIENAEVWEMEFPVVVL